MAWTRQRLQKKVRTWIWCKAGEVIAIEISGMYLTSTQDVICARARGRRDKIPPIQAKFPLFSLVWLTPEAQEWCPSTWPHVSGQGLLDLFEKSGFAQENCKQSWIFKEA